METASLIGRPLPLITLAIGVAASLFFAQRRRECCAVLCALILPILAPVLKVLVDRPRPPAELLGSADVFGGLGFPSGHAFQSLVLLGFLTYLATVLISRTWLRRSAQAFLVFLTAAIGISRVYLGAHWPSDVLGAYLLGGACLAILVRGYQSRLPIIASR
jgi:undecaprenyl-diphosphatase